MASLLDARCGVPNWQQTEENVVRSCGKKTGLITGIIFAVIVLVISVMYYISDKKAKNIKKSEKDYNGNPMILVGGGIGAVLVFLACYFGIPFFSVMNWKTTQEQIKQCMKQGRSRNQCLESIQHYQEEMMRANATTEAGANIADAIRNRK